MTDKIETIGLAEYIHRVKQDLMQEQYLRSEDEPPLFNIEEIEIELSVVATKEGGGGGKASFKLGVPMVGEAGVELGSEGKYGKENMQTLRVKLGSLMTREEILAKMSPDQRAKIEESAINIITRSGDDVVSGSKRSTSL